jgi:hypothetical protein
METVAVSNIQRELALSFRTTLEGGNVVDRIKGIYTETFVS